MTPGELNKSATTSKVGNQKATPGTPAGKNTLTGFAIQEFGSRVQEAGMTVTGSP